jgi:chromosome segregation ATPase
MANPHDGADLTAYCDQLEAERDALQDDVDKLTRANKDLSEELEATIRDSARDYDEAIEELRAAEAERDRYKELVEAGEGRIKQIVDEDLIRQRDALQAEILGLHNEIEALKSSVDPPLDALASIWDLFREQYGEWEYPGQAARTVRAEFLAMRQQIHSQVEMLHRSRETIAQQKAHIAELLVRGGS